MEDSLLVGASNARDVVVPRQNHNRVIAVHLNGTPADKKWALDKDPSKDGFETL